MQSNPFTTFTIPNLARLRGTRSLMMRISALALVTVLAGCGGGGGSSPTTTITGAVVKGQVAGAQVCAFEVSANGAGASIGSCVTSGADGSYQLSLPRTSGDIWIEASGGNYLDEATQAQAALTATLRSLVTANGAAVQAFITPLTTLALAEAQRAAGARAVSATDYLAASAAVKQALGISANFDLTSTPPVVGSAANEHGDALATISRMIANGLPLSQLLVTEPSALTSAYAVAEAQGNGNGNGGSSGPTPPTAPTTPGQATAPSAAGSLTIAGGALSGFTPKADGFAVRTTADDVEYEFTNETSVAYGGGTSVIKGSLKVRRTAQGLTTVVLSNPSAAGFGGPGTTLQETGSCAGSQASPCHGVSITTPAGQSHPLTVSFANTTVGKFTLNGSLTADAGGAVWRVADLPGTSSGSVSLNASTLSLLTGSYDVTTTGGNTLRLATLYLDDGYMIVVRKMNSDEATTSMIRVDGSSLGLCNTACGVTMTENGAGSVLIALANTPYGGGAVVTGSLTLGRTTGTLTSAELGSFTPARDSIKTDNAKRTFTFDVLGTSAQAGISLVSVRLNGTRIEEVQVSTAIGSGAYGCFETAVLDTLPAPASHWPPMAAPWSSRTCRCGARMVKPTGCSSH